jgi:hypothetical protein
LTVLTLTNSSKVAIEEPIVSNESTGEEVSQTSDIGSVDIQREVIFLLLFQYKNALRCITMIYRILSVLINETYKRSYYSRKTLLFKIQE